MQHMDIIRFEGRSQPLPRFLFVATLLQIC